MRTNEQTSIEETPQVRLAELMAAFSVATDLAMGQPMEHALCSCVLAVRLGDALGMNESTLRNVYYQALLRFIGCNAETDTLSSLVGDELAMRHDFAEVDAGDGHQVISLITRYIRHKNKGASRLELAQIVARDLLQLPKAKEAFAGHCEVAQRLAARLGFDEEMLLALGQLYERWDGKGSPRGLRGESISPVVLVVTMAQDALIFMRLGGVEAAISVAQQRKGTAYDPRIVDCFCKQAETLCADLLEEPSWESVLAMEPGRKQSLSTRQIDIACQAIADFADIKSPYFLNHSSGVARLAEEASRRYGLPAADAVQVRRAGLLHDVGRAGVSTGIWGKQGSLTEREWEKVRMHPYYTERILAKPAAFSRIAAVATYNAERADGSGYHRGVPAAVLSPQAKILAAADVYQAMTELRPHRKALSAEAAADELRREVREGRLDSDAVTAVLEAAGHRTQTRHERMSGLSEREIQVLRLVAFGYSMGQIAAELVISKKTVDNHIQHIYNKAGVSTRAGAALFAMEHNLIGHRD